MPTTFKANRSRIILLLLCIIIFIYYKYMFSKDEPYADREGEMAKKSNVEHVDKRKDSPITVSIYYECLCPDSRSFFLHHLLPSYEKAPHLIDLEFIPYGKAKTEEENGQYKFSCQHGSVECYGNKIHACSIVKVKDPMILLKLLSCMIDDNLSPEDRGLQCCTELGIDWKSILDCARSVEGDVLLKRHGDATNLLRPPVSFIPTILLNQSQRDQRGILKNLWKEVCSLYAEVNSDLPHPAECLS